MCRSDCVSSAIVFLFVTCFGHRAAAQTLAGKPLSPPEISQLETNAQSGDPAARLALGRAYDEGNGVPQSDKLGGEVVPGSRRSGKCNCPERHRSNVPIRARC
jgi:hypothetical protein